MTDHQMNDGRPVEGTADRGSAVATAAPIPELPMPEGPGWGEPGPEGPAPRVVVAESVADMLSAFGGTAFAGAEHPAAGGGVAPEVGAVPGAGAAASTVVDDEQRTRYGVLLDRAAERGLLAPAEYEIRLRELASATTVERLRELVTELPVLDAPRAATLRAGRAGGRSGRGSVGSAVPPEVDLAPRAAPRRRTTPWVVLAVMVVALLVAMVFFAVYAEHLVHAHNSAAAAHRVAATAAGARGPLSAPRS